MLYHRRRLCLWLESPLPDVYKQTEGWQGRHRRLGTHEGRMGRRGVKTLLKHMPAEKTQHFVTNLQNNRKII